MVVLVVRVEVAEAAKVFAARETRQVADDDVILFHVFPYILEGLVVVLAEGALEPVSHALSRIPETKYRRSFLYQIEGFSSEGHFLLYGRQTIFKGLSQFRYFGIASRVSVNPVHSWIVNFGLVPREIAISIVICQ